jgi:TolB-like protein
VRRRLFVGGGASAGCFWEEELSGERVERRLAAILAADIAGYSRLMGQDEAGTLARLRTHRRELIDPKIAEHKGRIVKTTGDGMLIEFPSVVEAVACAVAVQLGMAERNAGTPEKQRIVFRVGVNLGDIIVEDDDIHGDGVNVAARLEGLAEPGGVCVSGIVHDQVRDKLDLTFDDIGEQALKNIARPVHVFRVVAEQKPMPKPAALPLPDKPSIAVLPFQNMSGDLEQEYFADGMVEEIITALSRIRWLFVIARNSSFAYKGKSPDVKQVGRELGVRYVLEGSVRKAGNRVRITGQLIDTKTGTHIWVDRFDGALDDIFELQDTVAGSVAGVIGPTLQAAEMHRSSDRATNDLTAYDLYLRALAPIRSGEWEKERYLQALGLLSQRLSAIRVTDPPSLQQRFAIKSSITLAGQETRVQTVVRASISLVGLLGLLVATPTSSALLPAYLATSEKTLAQLSHLSTVPLNSTRVSLWVGNGAAG